MRLVVLRYCLILVSCVDLVVILCCGVIFFSVVDCGRGVLSVVLRLLMVLIIFFCMLMFMELLVVIWMVFGVIIFFGFFKVFWLVRSICGLIRVVGNILVC